MIDGPGFDPYAVLGVSVEADAIVIQFAYKAAIRAVHPDIAGAAGLAQTKRLNAARDWLLDSNLRAQLPRSRTAQHPPGPRTTRRDPPPRWDAQARRRPETRTAGQAR